MKVTAVNTPGHIVPLAISYVRSKRAKWLRITVSPAQAVTVTVPLRMPMERAEEFVQSKQAWIDRHLENIRRIEKNRPVAPSLSDTELITAQKKLFARLQHLAATYNLPYNKAAFRCQKTRWGSCSGANNISLNINLVFLPEHLQDYVLLHELTHIRHKNHSRSFWDQLDEYCGGRAKKWAKELKNHTMQLQS